MVLMFLFPGMFMETIPILFVVLPFLDPIAASAGINPILYAVILIELLEIEDGSPPFRLNLFPVLAATDKNISTGELYRRVFPFLVLYLITFFYY